jgi:hypothetical protein
MSDIDDAKQNLPLPELMDRLGCGEHAKKSAKCPFHDDRHNSFSVWCNDAGRWFWKCHTGCGGGDEITFLELHEGLSNAEAIKRYLELAGVNDSVAARVVGTRKEVKLTDSPTATPQSFDWQRYVGAFTMEHIERLSKWRGYSIELCSWLKENHLIGLYQDCIAFPVRNGAGNVVAIHYRVKDGTWRYHPIGEKVLPFVIGEPVPGDTVYSFESYWDAFTFMDKSGERHGIVITRGASNTVLVADVIPKDTKVYLWPQNDSPGEKWAKDLCASATVETKVARIPAPHKDLNDWTRAGATHKELFEAMVKAEVVRERERPLIEFRSPLQLKNFVSPPGIVMVGDCHVVKGSTFVTAGPPGVGKSRSGTALAIAGATESDWFGLTVHRRFRTMIVQTENGEFRLTREFADLDCNALEDYVRICPPPPFGMCLQRDDFRAQLAAEIADFKPDIVIFDPWNAAARDEKAREYLDTFHALRSVLPLGDDAPALGIVAHTRKPKTDERASGRALLNLLAGSYVLGSVPRTVFVMQPASDDTTDNRVVWTCCKNNDGELGARSAWERRNGLFAPVTDFDWDTFDSPHADDRVTIAGDDLAEIFENGAKQLRKAEAVKALETLTGAKRTACYNALRANGKFAKHLDETHGLHSWKPQ